MPTTKFSTTSALIFTLCVVAHVRAGGGKGSKASCYTSPVWRDIVHSLTSNNVIPMPAAGSSYPQRELQQPNEGHSAVRGEGAQQQGGEEGRHLGDYCGRYRNLMSFAAANQEPCLIAGGYPVYADNTFLGCPTSCTIDADDVKAYCTPAQCNMMYECDTDPVVIIGNADEPMVYCCPKDAI